MRATFKTGVVALAGAAVFNLLPARAQVVWTVGIGNTSCATAMRNMEKTGAGWENHYLTWLGGFISGYNMAVADHTHANARVGEGIPNGKIADLLKASCKKDPSKPLPQVAAEIRANLAAFRE